MLAFQTIHDGKKFWRYDGLMGSGFVKSEHVNNNVNKWLDDSVFFCFWHNYGLTVWPVWLMSALEIWCESRITVFYQTEEFRKYGVKNKTSICKQEANIKVLQNSYLLKFDVNTMLAIPNVTEWKSIVITFSAVPSWLATTIFKNCREVEEPKHPKTDC